MPAQESVAIPSVAENVALSSRDVEMVGRGYRYRIDAPGGPVYARGEGAAREIAGAHEVDPAVAVVGLSGATVTAALSKEISRKKPPGWRAPPVNPETGVPRKVMDLLGGGASHSVRDMLIALGIPDGSLSSALAGLKQAGLVTNPRRGVWVLAGRKTS